MRRLAHSLLLVLLALPACYTWDDYWQEQAEALCQLYDDCGYLDYIGATSYDECLDRTLDGQYDCEGFQREAAKECVAGIEALDCEDFDAGQWPSACSAVCESTSNPVD